MTFRNFSSPHVHVASLDSASTPEAFAKRELELGTGTLTCTDHGTLQTTRAVYDLCHSKQYEGKLTPILGLEAYFRDDDCPILTAANIEKHLVYEHPTTYDRLEPEKYEKLKEKRPNEAAPYQSRLLYDKYSKYQHVTLHFCDEAAFSTACRLLSKRDLTAEKHGSERKCLFTWADMEELCAQNVTVGSGCINGMAQAFLAWHNRPDLAEAYYKRLRGMVRPGQFFVEVFPHVLNKEWTSAVVVKFEDGTEEKFSKWKNLNTDKAPKKGD